MSSLKAITADLLSVTTGAYDQTKTTLLGSMALQTFSGIPAVSPPANQWLDVFTDSGETPLSMEYTVNGRLFVITAITAGLARVIAYSLNATTGVHTYLGKIQLTFPNLAATTHTIRGFKIDDTNTSNIKIFVRTTANVLINGGTFLPLRQHLVLGKRRFTFFRTPQTLTRLNLKSHRSDCF
jgi:hypothetical protein